MAFATHFCLFLYKPGLHIDVMIVSTVATHASSSVLSNFDTLEHFDYGIGSFANIVINCSVSSSCNDPSHHSRHVSSLVSSCIANLNRKDTAKQLLTPLRLTARKNFSLKYYGYELFNLIERSGK